MSTTDITAEFWQHAHGLADEATQRATEIEAQIASMTQEAKRLRAFARSVTGTPATKPARKAKSVGSGSLATAARAILSLDRDSLFTAADAAQAAGYKTRSSIASSIAELRRMDLIGIAERGERNTPYYRVLNPVGLEAVANDA